MTGLRPSRVVAVAGLVLSVVCYAVTVVGAGFVAGVTPPAAADIVWFTGFLAFPLVGAVIAAHRPANRVGWLFLAVGVLQFGAAILDGLAQHALLTCPGCAAGPLLVLAQNALFAVAWVCATTYPLLLFPDGDPPTPRWRWVLHATTGALVLLVASVVLTPGRVVEDDPADNPFGVPALSSIAPLVTTGTLFALLGLTLVAMTSFIVRWRRAGGVDRRRLAWLALAALVFIGTTLAGLLVDRWTPSWVGALLEGIGIAALPVAVGMAILRAGLFDIASALDHTLTWTALSAIVVVTYLGSLAATSAVLAPEGSRGASLVVTAVVAVSLNPVKDRLLRGIDRVLFGDRDRPYQVITGLAERLSRTVALEELLHIVTETLTTMLRVPYARVVLDADVDPPPGALAFPLVSNGRQEGTLLVGQRGGRARFEARERDLLADVAGQIAVAVRATRLEEDLRESRERIVRAREEERRRMRRDLHDGLGPLLAAASLQIDVLADRVADDPGAHPLTTKIKSVISQSVTDVRQIVHGLRPPSLDDLGLPGVVREHAAALCAAGLDVEVDCPDDLGITSAAVEVAAYRIVTEAMTNVVRHAGAARCRVVLAVEGGWLRLDVTDDGRGLSVPHRDGVGLASMRARADELGGTVTIEPGADGGTRVSALLPVPGASETGS
ncbi:Histidine kinase-, DNA gyrase B-, and HSP90-like ATPase [Micromonospora viridifaciens]|uniref:histidine kinase n=1 Tax=Micromonospora viridifaciens TaxID=1881 RepID=A0A1C4YZJ2_MICVI|nr:GAF domain-containing sensor histidine kinase [Micromonospora viridifaciens]SCF26057.1 Histidine kinase-, DNA gyrase B-, and HSP90-like ATPase [Micromonospora viridifaciens]